MQRKLRTREDIVAWREQRLRHFLDKVAPRTPFYRDFKGADLSALPVMDKARVLENFHLLNVAGVTSAEAWAAIDKGERVRGLVAGYSTGTSGNRGLFLISDKERFIWLGVLLAKTLTDFPWRKYRVALALPASSALYDSATETGRITLRFFDLRLGLRAWRDQLDDFAPDTIVAPPKVLRALAEDPRNLRPKHLFSAAEILDPLDRQAIELAFDVNVREIYQATEGLFAVACPHGTLHLCEDIVAFEWEDTVPGSRTVSPLITDFTRTSQVMARYRMNDLIELSDTSCACGSPLQPVRSILGRADDVFILRAGDGEPLLITPDVLRNAVVDADRRIENFRVTQLSEAQVEVRLPEDLGLDMAGKAAAAVLQTLRNAGAADVDVIAAIGVTIPYDKKLRRVHRAWSPS
ncbi:MAG: F390 synthetase-related protein, partial [Sphingomicrobium sp.]